jgi:demethylmenaquinone methyltransferase/2-methoxy-6-polyprenyl-1,4-benzoquinol methylase
MPSAAALDPPGARKRHALELFAGLPARYDRMGALLSFGQDPRWRAAMVAGVDPRPGQRILDVATGTGMVAAALARRGADVVALDQSDAMLDGARARFARASGSPAVELVRGEAEALPFGDASFDGLTFTYLLRYVDDPGAVMAELARVVRPGGRIGMVEFGVPGRRGTLAFWRWHTRVGLPGLGRLASPAWEEVGRFLGPNIEGFYAAHPLPALAGLWRAAGIGQVGIRRMSFGAGIVMNGVRDGDVTSGA